MRQLEIYSHQGDTGPSGVTHVTLSDDGEALAVGPPYDDIVKGQTKRLERFLGRRPTNTEVFEHLASWSNGYTAGREIVS